MCNRWTDRHGQTRQPCLASAPHVPRVHRRTPAKTKVAYGRFKAVLRNDGSGNMAIKAGSRDGVAIRNEGRGATKKLPGGGRQFYIPNLKPEYYKGFAAQSLVAM